MGKIFITGSTVGRDREIAALLGQYLSEHGHQVWNTFSVSDDSEWSDAVTRRIHESHVFIVVLTKKGVEHNEDVVEQTGMALESLAESRRPAILGVRVLYDGPLGPEMDLILRTQRVLTWRTAADLPKILDAIRAISPHTEPPEAVRPTDRSREVQPLLPKLEDDRDAIFFLGARGGPSDIHDPLYVKRAVDERVAQAARLGESIIVHGPPQRGRTSVLFRYAAASTAQKKTAVILDLTNMHGAMKGGLDGLLAAIAEELASSLGLHTQIPPMQRLSQMKMFMEKVVLPGSQGGLTLALDNVDRVMGHSYQDEFFSMLRHWYEASKSPTSSHWRTLSIALSISTSPTELIKDEHVSPYNVFRRFDVDNLAEEECVLLDERYPAKVRLGPMGVSTLYALLGGHPYLTRTAYYLVACEGMSLQQLRDRALDLNGPFGFHLRSLVLRFGEREKPLLAGILRVLLKQPIEMWMAVRLLALGIIVPEVDGWRFSCDLYRRFFARLFKRGG